MAHISMEKLSESFDARLFSLWIENYKLVFIAAGTGKGKTHMIISSMAKELSEKSFLYLTNRKRLDDEIKLRVDQYEAGNIEPRTYQNIENINKFELDIDCFDVIICDECHYFVSDSSFNRETFRSFEKIMKSPACKIFLTATPEAILPLLTELKDGLQSVLMPAEDYFYNYEMYTPEDLLYWYPEDRLYKIQIGKELDTTVLLQDYGIEKMVFYCDIPPLQKKLNEVIIYTTEDELEFLLSEVPDGDKVLMFLSTITMTKLGKGILEWKKTLESKGKTVSIAFSDGTINKKVSSKDKKASKITQEELIMDKKFKTQYLLATKALDNGIDIIDSDVKYIVCDLNEVNTITLRQCIGRVRLAANEKITVIVRNKYAITKQRCVDCMKCINQAARYFELERDPEEFYELDMNLLATWSRVAWNGKDLVVLRDPLKIQYFEYEISCCNVSYKKLLKDDLGVFGNSVRDVHAEALQAKHQELAEFLEMRKGCVLEPLEQEKIKNLTGKGQIGTINKFLVEREFNYQLVVKKTKEKNRWMIEEIDNCL